MFNLDMDKVESSTTKEYLKEVISSLENKNYRSAVVMLYTVIMVDLIDKLRELKDFGASKRAAAILNEVQQSNKSNNGHYESTENTLISEILKAPSKDNPESLNWLLNDSAANTVKTVKNYRNLCAHPAFDQNRPNKLMEPNKDLVAGLIRSCFDDIFSRPAKFGKDVFSTLLDDLKNSKDYFLKLDDDSLKEYLLKNYLVKFNDDTYKYVVKNLFKEVFCRDSEDENENRKINYRSLIIMIANKESDSRSAIKESNYYQQMINKDDNKTEITDYYLSLLLQRFPKFFQDIPKGWKNELIRYSREEPIMGLENYFIDDSDDFLAYEKNILGDDNLLVLYKDSKLDISVELKNLYKIYQGQGYSRNFFELLNNSYTTSAHFDDANDNYKKFIEPFIKNYDEKSIKKLIKEANNNSQCYGRYRAATDHLEIYEAYTKIVDNPLSKQDFKEKYPNFCYYFTEPSDDIINFDN